MNKDFDILTGRSDKHVTPWNWKENQYLLHHRIHGEVATFFENIVKQNPTCQPRLVSAFRSYEHQLKIWNEKVEGKRAVLGRDEKPIEIASLSEDDMINTLLIWSHIPGCSRHHWGSDFDYYDHHYFSIHPHEKLKLTVHEYQPGGPCHDMYQLVARSLALPHSPFFMPYEQNRSSGNPYISYEPWHISHKSLAAQFAGQYSYETFHNNLMASSQLLLQKQLLKRSKELYNSLFPSKK